MKRKFLTNLTLLILLNLLVKPFWVFGIDLTVQNRVGATEYGFYFSLLSFSLLLNILQDMGIASYNNRAVARNHGLVSELLPNILLLKLLLAFAYFTISFAIAWIIGYQLIQLKLLAILLFNQFLNSMNLYLRSNIGGLQLFRTDSFLSVTDRLLMIIICSFLLWGNIIRSEFSIEWYVYAQTAAYLITLAVTTLIVLKHSGLIRPGFNPAIIRKMLKESYPYALLGLLMVIYYRTDSVMLERMLHNGQMQAGIYAQGFRILDAASMLGFLFAGILLPLFAKMIKHNEPVVQLFRFSFTLLIVPSVTAAIALNYYRLEIMDLLYTSHAEEAAGIFGVLMISFVFISCSIISGTLLTANGNIKYLNAISLTGVMINIILNILLIPRYQALGSAFASLITQVFVSAMQVVKAMNILGIRPGASVIKGIVTLTGMLILTGYALRYFDVNWILGLLIIGLTGLVTAFATKLITTNEIKDSLF